MKIERNFRVFKHVKSINDENEKFFSKLGQRMATLACENKVKTVKLKSFKPSDLELIKTSANGKYKNVCARIYMSSTGKVSCRVSECKKVEDVFKRREMKIGNLVDESFKGSCKLMVYQVYVGSRKMITLSVDEIMATKLKRSYFDEYEEMVSNESSLEEAD